MNPSIWAGSKPPYGWATYSTGIPRSGKMSRDMRSSARNPSNAVATTIVKSEIGRRNANDTKFMRAASRRLSTLLARSHLLLPPSRKYDLDLASLLINECNLFFDNDV